jgi:hypothetical protein
MFAKSVVLVSVLSAMIHAGVSVMEEGKTYEYAETDLLEAIEQRIEGKKPEIDAKVETFRSQAKERAESYKPKDQIALPRTTKNRVFKPSLVYTLDRNIYDAKGNVVYPKGFSYKISKYTSLPYEIIVFDGTDPKQKQWVIDNNFHTQLGQVLMITDGRVFELSRELKKPVYFAINKLQERFELKNVPCRIKQIGEEVTVTEVCVTCEDAMKIDKKETN